MKFMAFIVGSITLLAPWSCCAAAVGSSPYPELDKPPPFKDEWSQFLNAPANGAPDTMFCPGEKDWGLTYDDGPSEFTPAILDHLKAKNVKATFFIVGSRLAETSQNKDVLKRAFDEGHQIAIHTYSHSQISKQTDEAIIAEVMWTGQLIQEVIGVFPNYFRPPYGDIDPRSRTVLQRMGLTVVIWNQDTEDWKLEQWPSVNEGISPDKVISSFEDWVKSPQNGTGVISLEHDLWKYSAQQAPQGLDIVLGAGYKVKPVWECINGQAPYRANLNVGSTMIMPNSTNTTLAANVTASALLNATTTATANVSMTLSKSAIASVATSRSDSPPGGGSGMSGSGKSGTNNQGQGNTNLQDSTAKSRAAPSFRWFLSLSVGWVGPIAVLVLMSSL
ncbi:chitin deacetylase [Blyttiomyces sp. JEL0837]|nr:chitin deacetylase [Blyttiomyces sp. JEL0837]